jgi:hypothetical protein
MRFNFDLHDANLVQRRSVTPKDEVEWVPLQNHPVFSSSTTEDHVSTSATSFPRNLVAWDGASRLYFWDSNKHCLHRISIKLGEPEPTSVLAASPSKVLSLFYPFELNRPIWLSLDDSFSCARKPRNSYYYGILKLKVVLNTFLQQSNGSFVIF